jgi:hypothetical protein
LILSLRSPGDFAPSKRGLCVVEASRLNLSSFTIQRYEKKRYETILSPRFFSEIYKKNRNAAYATVPLCHCVAVMDVLMCLDAVTQWHSGTVA